MARKSKVKYIGEGRFIYRVPPRDMTMKEWQQIGKAKRDLALELGLYDLGATKDGDND